MQVKCPYCKTEFHHKRSDVLTCPACKEMFHLSEEEMEKYPEDDTAEEEMCQNISDHPEDFEKQKVKKEIYNPIYRYYNLYACAIGILCIFGTGNGSISLFAIMIGLVTLFISVHYGSIVLKYGETKDKVIAWFVNFVAIILIVVFILLFMIFAVMIANAPAPTPTLINT